jgi:hypothetical protein
MDEKHVGDPLASPRPMDQAAFHDARGAVEPVLGCLISAAGAVVMFLAVIGMDCGLVRGGTRSARLKWTERQRQVDAAVQAEKGRPERR